MIKITSKKTRGPYRGAREDRPIIVREDGNMTESGVLYHITEREMPEHPTVEQVLRSLPVQTKCAEFCQRAGYIERTVDALEEAGVAKFSVYGSGPVTYVWRVE